MLIFCGGDDLHQGRRDPGLCILHASRQAEGAVMRLLGMMMAAAMLTAGAPALAEGDAAMGAVIYRTYCASCHGIEATGSGPMVTALVVQPADLTTLSARHDGVFPLERVAARIDGRDPLVSHGSAMPVYGDYFEGRDVALKTASGQPLMTSQPIADVVAWLESVQK
jgi:mono/diheme cytochrome c family protein